MASKRIHTSKLLTAQANRVIALRKVYRLAQAFERADDSSEPAGVSFAEMMAQLKQA